MSKTMLHLDISQQFGSHNLCAKVDVPLQGITALQGPSGSGKTLLLRIISGLEKQPGASIRFGDTVWQSQNKFVPPQARRIGYVFQDTRLFGHLDVAGNLGFGHRRAGAAPEILQVVTEALDLGPLLTRQIYGLSGGEKQRVALGRALAMQPQLLLLDEPLTGLDQARKSEILPYITAAVQATGCPAIYVSHERRETAILADRIMQMRGGKLSAPVECETTVLAVLGAGGALFVDGQKTGLVAAQNGARTHKIRINTDSVILSRDNPGQSSALLSLPVEITSLTRENAGDFDLVLAGQGWQIRLSKPAAVCLTMQLQAGQRIWLNVTQAQVLA